MTDEEQHRQKEVEHYAASAEAWYNTRLELDKSLLTLSAGGIGLLLTLMSAFGIHSIESLVLYILSLVAFVVCLAAVLCIFSRNSKHLEDVLRDGLNNDPWLSVLDKVAISTFLAGVIFSLIIGTAGAVQSLVTQEKSMSADEKKGVSFQDSFNRAASIRPTPPDLLNKSFNGAANIRPTPPPTATVQNQAPQQPQAAQQANTAAKSGPPQNK